MIRPLSESKNPAGAGIFAERRIHSFSGIKRDIKTFFDFCAFDPFQGKNQMGFQRVHHPLDGEFLKGVCIPLLSVVVLA